jgi:hypothetical protein
VTVTNGSVKVKATSGDGLDSDSAAGNGVYGTADSATGNGVTGTNNVTASTASLGVGNYGVWAWSNPKTTGSDGVYSQGYNGVYGIADDPAGSGVIGASYNTAAQASLGVGNYGVWAWSNGTDPASDGVYSRGYNGVDGHANIISGVAPGAGVVGNNDETGATASLGTEKYGVWAWSPDVAGNYGVYSQGGFGGVYGIAGDIAGDGVYGSNLGSGLWGAFGCQYSGTNYGLCVGGDAYVTGAVHANSFPQISDIRLKKDIRPIEDALDQLLRINGVRFNWKNDGRADLGVVAQNVAEVFPELVRKDEKGMMSVEYGNLVGPVIEAIRLLKADNDVLRGKLAEQADLTTAIEREVQDLKAADGRLHNSPSGNGSETAR